jgi:Type I phosphodiesterase / nucleotide pyrophosphatase
VDPATPQLCAGGFRKFFEKGAWFPDCRHLSSTFSSCGYANLATGTWPSQHGIVADHWFDRAAARAVAASDEDLLATTLCAQAVAAGTRVSVVAQSRAHAALFAAARAARLFYQDDAGRFAAAGIPPDWLDFANQARPVEAAHGAPWMAVNAASDAPPLRTLSYDAAHPQEFISLYKASPFGQKALFDFAGELLSRDKLGQGEDPDLLCILDGSAALLGYETGGHSPLMRQMVLQLDRRLEDLMAQLTRAVGENGFNLVVCAAHGAPPEPAPAARARMAVSGEVLAQAVETSLRTVGSGVAKYIYPFLYLKNAEGDNDNIRLRAAQAAMEQPAVAGYYTARGNCSAHDEWERRFRNSFHMKRSGDVMLSYRPEYVEDFAQGRGVSYGSFYNYDASVPLLLYGPQFRAGVFESTVQAIDVAPTLARALGIAEPSSAGGRVLGEALAL